MLSHCVVLRAKSHANQMVGIICSVLLTGRYAEIYEAQLMAIADRKGFGVIAECEHCGAKRRAKQCKVSCGDKVHFHITLFQANAVPKEIHTEFVDASDCVTDNYNYTSILTLRLPTPADS